MHLNDQKLEKNIKRSVSGSRNQNNLEYSMIDDNAATPNKINDFLSKYEQVKVLKQTDEEYQKLLLKKDENPQALKDYEMTLLSRVLASDKEASFHRRMASNNPKL